MNRVLAFVVLLLGCGLPAPAAEGDAPDEIFRAQALKDVCSPSPSLDQNAKEVAGRICQAYLRGVADGLFMFSAVQGTGARICLPHDGPLSPAEVKAELEDYLADHPDAVSHSAGLTAAFAILAAHPCE